MQPEDAWGSRTSALFVPDRDAAAVFLGASASPQSQPAPPPPSVLPSVVPAPGHGFAVGQRSHRGKFCHRPERGYHNRPAQQQYHEQTDRQYQTFPDQQYQTHPDQRYQIGGDKKYRTHRVPQYQTSPDGHYQKSPHQQYYNSHQQYHNRPVKQNHNDRQFLCRSDQQHQNRGEGELQNHPQFLRRGSSHSSPRYSPRDHNYTSVDRTHLHHHYHHHYHHHDQHHSGNCSYYDFKSQPEDEKPQKGLKDSWYTDSPYYRSLSGEPEINVSNKHFEALRRLPDLYYSKIKNTIKNNKRMPHKFAHCGQYSSLSQGIWDKYCAHRQKSDTYTRKILLWKHLNSFLEILFPRYVLYMTGSTLNGFGTEQSDLDMCLLVWGARITRRVEAMAHLEQLLQGLLRCQLARRAELIPAKVPILKFRDARWNLEVDVNCNNDVAIRNTHLLFCFSEADWRVKPLVIVVKLWAARHNINAAKCMTLSSYSLVLMVIHYLQCGTEPAVLPSLGRLRPYLFSTQRSVLDIDVHERADVPRSANKQCLGELLLGFFRYYADFEYGHYAISVRLGSTVPVEECRRAPSPKNDERQWNLLCVEEPLELTNTAYAVFDESAFRRVLDVIRTSYYKLLQTGELQSIFQPIYSPAHRARNCYHPFRSTC